MQHFPIFIAVQNRQVVLSGGGAAAGAYATAEFPGASRKRTRRSCPACDYEAQHPHEAHMNAHSFGDGCRIASEAPPAPAPA